MQVRDTKAQRYPQRSNLIGAYRYLGASRGQQRGEHTSTGNGGRRTNAAWGTGTSGGVWRVVGAGNVQVGSAFHRDRRWVLVLN